MMMIIIIIIIINFIKIIIVIIIIILDKIWAFPSRAGEPKYLYEKLSPLTWHPSCRGRTTRGGGGDIIMVIRDHVNSLHTVQIKKRNMCIFFFFVFQ